MEKIVFDGKKQIAHLRAFLKGAKMFDALRTLNLVEDTYGSDLRKDGKTLSVTHPVQIALSVLMLPLNEVYKENAIVLSLLHDMVEDYNLSLHVMNELYGTGNASKYYEYTCQLSKVVGNEKKDNVTYFAGLTHYLTVLVKGLDRLNNLNSMVGCFTVAKMTEQVEETKAFVLPMLKTGERKYPEVELALYAIRHQMIQVLNLLQEIIKKDK